MKQLKNNNNKRNKRKKTNLEKQNFYLVRK